MGAEGGGKLRKSILTGANSEPMMATLRAMAIICDTVLWPLLRAVKPAADKHVLDVLPEVWPKAVEFFRDVAQRPAGVLEGSLKLDVGGPPPTPASASQAKRSERARIDMVRIRAAAAGDPTVERLLKVAFAAMADATENHAAEWLEGGKLAKSKITPEMRAKYDALVSTSTAVERIHALGRCSDDRSGMQRADTRAGVCLARYNGQTAWLRSKTVAELKDSLNISRLEARKLLRITVRHQRIEAGRAKRAAREEKLTSKRAKRVAAAAERLRVEGLTVATKYSEVAALATNAELSDQLKYHKLVRKAVGFTATQGNRTAYVLQLQVSPPTSCPSP